LSLSNTQHKIKITQIDFKDERISKTFLQRIGARGGAVVEELPYKPEGVIGIFNLHNPFGRTMTLGLTQK
jgi:hypothetical protein